MYMLLYVANDIQQAKDMLEVWVKAGVRGVTMMEGVGMRQLMEKGELRRDDLGLMPSLRTMLRSQEVPRRSLFSVIDSEEGLQRVTAASTAFVEDWTRPNVGVLFVWPITQAYGLNKIFEE